MENKTCTDCGEEKPLNKFPFSQNKKKGSKRYYFQYCYACRNKNKVCKKDNCNKSPWREGYCRDHKDLVSASGIFTLMYSKKSAYLNYIYNITLEDYRIILNDVQGGVCPLCKNPAPSIYEMLEGQFWHVDHDHGCCPRVLDGTGNNRSTSCGECIRGILCHLCNLALNENVNEDWLNNALVYIKGSK